MMLILRLVDLDTNLKFIRVISARVTITALHRLLFKEIF